MFSLEEYRQFRATGWLPLHVDVLGRVVGVCECFVFDDVKIRVVDTYGTCNRWRHVGVLSVGISYYNTGAVPLVVGDKVQLLELKYYPTYVLEKVS